jgi:hypothetical protein
MSNNPNQNILNFTITAPSLPEPIDSEIQADGDIIIDITNPPPNLDSKPITQLLNIPGNISLSNMYPSGSVFTDINGSSIIDSTQPHQMIILYDQTNKVVENIPSNYPKIKRIKSYFNKSVLNLTPSISSEKVEITLSSPSTSSSKPVLPSITNDNMYIYIFAAIIGFFLLGGGISFSFNPGSKSSSGGRSRYIDYGE